MDPEKIKAALDAIEAGDEAAALALLKEMIASAAGAASDEGDDAPADEGEPALAEEPEEEEEEPVATSEDECESVAAKALKRLTGRASVGEAIAQLSASLKRVKALDAERAALELDARRELVADLVKLGAELPATAWEGKPEARKPCKRLASEPIAELRARVNALRDARPEGLVNFEPPTAPDVKKLSAKELAACKARNIDPADFAARKAAAVRRSTH